MSKARLRPPHRNDTRIYLLLACVLLCWPSNSSAAVPQVERFGFYEVSFQASARYANPFVGLKAHAELKRPDGSIWTIPLFWDGSDTWKLRVSPDLTGTWTFSILSPDNGLNGKKGSFTCIRSKRRGSIQAMPQYNHHFACQDGTPFLFWGDTAWGLYLDQASEKLNRKSVFRYIDKRSEEGINVIHSMLLSEAGWGNSGGPPFFDMQAQTINPAYWQEVDARVKYLNAKGIIAGLVLAWGDKRKQEPYAWRMFPDLDARKNYAQYIAARYGVFDVFFIIAGEWHAEARTRPNTSESDVKQEFIALGDVFAKAEAHGRMIAIHPMTSSGSVREFNQAAWMSFGDYQQNYADLHGRLLESRRLNKPLVNSEYGYYLRDSSGNGKVDKHNSFGPEDMRFATWDIIMAGAYPITGYGTTYMGGHRDPGPFNPDDPRNDVWARHYHLAQAFLADLEWWKLQPRDDKLSCAQARSSDRQVRVRMSPTRTRTVRRPSLAAYWLLADTGRSYVVYARGITEPIEVLLDNGVAKAYRVQQYNPRTGERKALGKRVQLHGQFKWIPPDAQDWVVHLDRVE